MLAHIILLGTDRVIAVHCRGGKGRTGSMVCTWLIYSQFVKDSEESLTYFARARTELRKSSTKLQGVDTPSQKRFVVIARVEVLKFFTLLASLLEQVLKCAREY